MRTVIVLAGVLLLSATLLLAADSTTVAPASAAKVVVDTATATAAPKTEVKPTETAMPTKATPATGAKAAADTGKAVATPKSKAKPAAAAQKETPAKWVTSKTGLRYADHVVGKGDEAVKGDTVEVHYTGWLDEGGKHGKKFDSSVDRGSPFVFTLGAGHVIKGWEEGVAGMKVGGKRELVIPPDLGYGVRGAGNGLIPPNATLIFEVELLKVHKPAK